MVMDFNRLRANAAADKDAYKYYREIQTTKSAQILLDRESRNTPGSHIKSFSQSVKGFILNRPLALTGSLFLTAGAAVLLLQKYYFTSAPGAEVVEQHIKKLEKELLDYEEHLKSL